MQILISSSIPTEQLLKGSKGHILFTATIGCAADTGEVTNQPKGLQLCERTKQPRAPPFGPGTTAETGLGIEKQGYLVCPLRVR